MADQIINNYSNNVTTFNTVYSTWVNLEKNSPNAPLVNSINQINSVLKTNYNYDMNANMSQLEVANGSIATYGNYISGMNAYYLNMNTTLNNAVKSYVQ